MPGWVAALLVEKGVGIGATAFSLGVSDTPPKGIPLDGGEKLAIAGGGTMMLLGVGMILLAFFDPEPTTKLGLLVGGGIATALGGGAVLPLISSSFFFFVKLGRVYCFFLVISCWPLFKSWSAVFCMAMPVHNFFIYQTFANDMPASVAR